MAIDEAIQDAVITGMMPPTLRLYRFNAPAITLGRFQEVSRSLDTAACRALQLDIVRRPTGGRGILHGGDQTISLVVPQSYLGSAGRSVAGSYRVLAAGFQRGLERLGIRFTQSHPGRAAGRGGDCFASRTAADLTTVGGEKLLGCAQRRREGVMLQQCSLRHRPLPVTAAQVFLGKTAPESYPLCSLSEEELAEALLSGFREALGLRLIPGSVSGWEEERTCVIQAGLHVDISGR